MCGKKIASKNGRKSIKNRWGVMDTMAGRRVRLGVVLERLGVDRLAIGWRSFGGFFWGRFGVKRWSTSLYSSYRKLKTDLFYLL